jgi:hypothetical protein
VEANGSAAATTTKLTLNFSQNIVGLGAADISLTPSSFTKDSLEKTGTGEYVLSISGVTNANKGTVSVAVAKIGYAISNSPRDVTVFYAVPVTFSDLTANGTAGSVITTMLTLKFSPAFGSDLSTGDITLDPKTTGATKGSLVKVSGTEYTLGLNGVSSAGKVKITVAKTGYSITGSPKEVDVHYTSPLISASFSELSANGTAGSVTTTALTLTFDKVISGLSAADINLYPSSTGAIKGSLNGSGPMYTLSVSGISAAGEVQVTVSKGGYTITPLIGKTVAVYSNSTPFVDDLVEVGDILIGSREVTAYFYDFIKAWAKANGYNFTHTSIGIEHSAMDPGPAVGGIAFLEAVVWCNALTEYYNYKHGLTGAGALVPVYLGSVSATDQTPLTARDVTKFYHYNSYGLGAYSRVTAETTGKLGFRLPMRPEWEAGYNANKYIIPGGGFAIEPYDWTFTYYQTTGGTTYWYYTGNPSTGTISAGSLQINLTGDKKESFRIAINKSSLQ